MNIDVTGSIVTYKNNPVILLKAVNSFLNTSLSVFLFIIDNSPSNDLEYLFNDTRIHYIHNPSNPGFGASHNIAIIKSHDYNPSYHLILNPDIYFETGTIEIIQNFMNHNNDIGHLMPRILFPNNKLQFLCKTNPTIFDLFARGFMPELLKSIFKKRLNKYEYKNYHYNDVIYDVPYLSGCFMFFRFNTLKKVGFFDEKYFMYLEDADITRRFLKISHTIYFPHATVYHYYEGLTHKKLKFKLITIQSAFTYFNKWGWIKHIA
jgi:GT2 family glycosyltransferase